MNNTYFLKTCDNYFTVHII